MANMPKNVIFISALVLNTLLPTKAFPAGAWERFTDRDRMHPYHLPQQTEPGAYMEESDQPGHGFVEGDYVKTNWINQGQSELKKKLGEGLRIDTAKNIILFVGDGMGVTTTSMARIFKAQERNLTGNEAFLSWEHFPYSSIARTYDTTTQTPDSGATATALVCGVKTSSGVIGLNQHAIRANCSSASGNNVKSALIHAQEGGNTTYYTINEKWTGIISTARITHATPAAAYASVPEREWESDADLPGDATGCKDIAAQLIDTDHGKKIRVILGGGRANFYPNDVPDIEYPDQTGSRTDNRSLPEEWVDEKINDQNVSPENVKYVTNLTDFMVVDTNTVEYLMGLFEPSHMQYEAVREQRDHHGEPSLANMVEKSIDILSRNMEQGYLLFVEAGRIDHAHHANRAYHALMDTLALQDAVEKAVDKTDDADTLIIVTADHSHAFAMAGYIDLSDDVLGLGGVADDDKPYTSAGYTNGPGYLDHRTPNGSEDQWQPRMNLTGVDVRNITYRQDAGIYLDSETHGGEDVTVHAMGPMSHLFHGVHEQNYIAHAMMYAACIGDNKDHCEEPRLYPGCTTSSGSFTKCTSTSSFISFMIYLIVLSS